MHARTDQMDSQVGTSFQLSMKCLSLSVRLCLHWLKRFRTGPVPFRLHSLEPIHVFTGDRSARFWNGSKWIQNWTCFSFLTHLEPVSGKHSLKGCVPLVESKKGFGITDFSNLRFSIERQIQKRVYSHKTRDVTLSWWTKDRRLGTMLFADHEYFYPIRSQWNAWISNPKNPDLDWIYRILPQSGFSGFEMLFRFAQRNRKSIFVFEIRIWILTKWTHP